MKRAAPFTLAEDDKPTKRECLQGPVDPSLRLMRKRERSLIDIHGRDWSDIFWRTGENGFACQMNSECKGFTMLRCIRWRLPRLEICACPVGCCEACSLPGTSSDWCKIFWFPTPWVCKQDWTRVALWKVPEGKVLSDFTERKMTLAGYIEKYLLADWILFR